MALQGREDVGTMTGGKGSFYPILLIVVLSVHSLIAGTALGLERSVAASFALLVALLAHKGSAAFALGVSLKSARFPRGRLVRMVALFSCMTPIVFSSGSCSRGFSQEAPPSFSRRFSILWRPERSSTSPSSNIIGEAFEEKVDLGTKFGVLAAGFFGMALLAVWT